MRALFVVLFVICPAAAWAYDSGSTGTEPLAPTGDVTITVPASGRLDYTTVNVPVGVTVRFVGDGPVTVLASGDVVIDGVIDVSAVGASAGAGGSAGGGAGARGGAWGFGPGGGVGAYRCGAGGGSGPTAPGHPGPARCGAPGGGDGALGPRTYLHGGSGGGGTDLGAGGGGGGALTIASSGVITVNGRVGADGGAGVGGSGSGGGGFVRLVAAEIAGAGVVSARAGGGCGGASAGGCGGAGVVRFEGDVVAKTLFRNSEPRASIASPGPGPSPSSAVLRIAGVNGSTTSVVLPRTGTVSVSIETEHVRPDTQVLVRLTVDEVGRRLKYENIGSIEGTLLSGSTTVELEIPGRLSSKGATGKVEAFILDLLSDE